MSVIVVAHDPRSRAAPAGFGYNAALPDCRDRPEMFERNMTIAGFDEEVSNAIAAEERRQEEHIELIASENYASPRVLEAQGSVLTNKYAEGYAGKRYYGGCENVDVVERVAIDRARRLFDADFVNVQPHSGSQANAAVYLALVEPGETVLGMSLADGGHLTHGASVNFSGKLYHAVQYGLDPETGEVDYRQVEALANEHRPKLIVAGFSAYSRVMDWQRFRDIADAVDAYLMIDMAHVAGLVAVGLYPNPVPIADVTTSTTHKTLGGPRGGIILARKNPQVEKKLNSALFPGSQGGPLMHVIAAKAVCFLEAMQPEFRQYQERVIANARVMAQGFQSRGHKVVSGGTDNHLFLMDLRSIDQDLTGRDAAGILHSVGVTINFNTIPFDPRPPYRASGLRVGLPAATTCGMREPQVEEVGRLMVRALRNREDEGILSEVRAAMVSIAAEFAPYPPGFPGRV